MVAADTSERSPGLSWRPWVIEVLCLIAAVGSTLFLVSHLATSSGRGELMFLDGDSMLTALFARSVLEGTAHDWAMSASLFVPELATFTLLAMTGWGVGVLQFLSAVLNFVGLYLVLRVCALTLPQNRARSAVAALLAYLVIVGLALLEGAGDRNSLEVASLLAMTTYYSATVLATILTVGLTARLVSRANRSLPLMAVLAGVVVVSVFSNPLFAAWAVLPLLVVLVGVGIVCRLPRRSLLIAAILIAGTVLGFLLRIPMRHALVTNTASYLRPAQMGDTLVYHGRLLAERLALPGGWAAVLVTGLLIALGMVLTVVFARSRHPGPLLLATFSWLAPIATNVGFILMGSGASRYLQLWAFVPALALIALVVGVRQRAEDPARRLRPLALALASAVAVAGVTLGSAALPSGVRAATTLDADVACAVEWANGTERVGGGQFWSIRAIKTHVDDPARILQISRAFAGDGWLVDRGDYLRHQSVSFVISDLWSARWELPEGYRDIPSTIVECGRFTIRDFGEVQIPLGPRWP